MEPVVRALDVGFGHTKFVSSVDGSEVRCAHFPSVACPTESDETTDPMGGRRKTCLRQLQSVTVATEISMKQTLRLAAAPACGRTPSLRPNRGTCDFPSSGRADFESVGRAPHSASRRGWVCCRVHDRTTAQSPNFSVSPCPRSGTDSNDIASQRFLSRFAFAVALAWMGVSPRRASLMALFETSAMLTADCPRARASAACRAIN